MNRRNFVIALVAALMSIVAPADSVAGEKTFLWKVERGETALYLLGSIHALKEEAYPLPPAIDAAFDEVEVVVFEIDLDDMTSAAVQMMAAGSLDEGRTLEQVVGPDIWSDFEAHAEKTDFDPSMFQGMKPWMAALTLAAFELSNSGYLSAAGLDTHLTQRAKETGKERIALESADFQVSLFAELTPGQSLDFLRYTLADLETMIPEMDRLYEHWRAGEVEPVEAALLDGFEGFAGVFEKMVVDRNLSWMQPIVDLLEGDRDAMVVVGSMHLVGEHGIVNLLRERGYTVVQQ